ncbi:MAG: cyclic nucleotide-binding domain-containing protein [Myxococcales bacterium]|nr:cyclic nucleotide-binding domain-containing protein [Myxococcales bacterium]
MSEWSSAVFDAPTLRALDERGRAEVMRAGRWRRLEDGEVLYQAGGVSDAVFVMAAGAVRLTAIRRGDEHETEIRRARPGDVLGQEAALPGAARGATATAVEPSELCEIPMNVLTRALTKSGGSEVMEREGRALRRSASRDLLSTLAFARELGPEDLALLLDGVRWLALPRRARLFGLGDPADFAYLVVTGLLQLQTEEDGRVQVRAYVSRGDLFGDEEALAGERRAVHAVAQGDCQLLAVPRALLRSLVDRNPGVLERIRRLRADREARQRGVADRMVKSTQHVFHDLYRLQMARSLLAIDQDACVRCGHCAWSCADAHDGVSRLVRRGDKIVTELAVVSTQAKSLMLPSSCQHCHNPVCMIDCPTGAIGRDPEGDVFIREELCTGCGACAKACPWDNIRMAPRTAEGPAEVAVKCDLCKGFDAPACVSACPTDAIVRLDPQRDFRELGALFGAPTDQKLAVEPRALSRFLPGVGLALALGLVPAGALLHARGVSPGRGLPWLFGLVAALACAALAGYAIPKRLARHWRRTRRAPTKAERLLGEATGPELPRSQLSPHYRLHVGLGLASLGAVALHAGPRIGSGVAGALSCAFWLTALIGAASALAYRVIPRRLSRLEHKGALPEDLALERDLLFDRLHRASSGTSELIKTITARLLVPYARAPLGPVRLVVSGLSLGEERRALRAQIEAVLAGRGSDRLDGLDDLVRIVVELRALPARRALTFGLRGLVPAHLLLTGVVLVLLLLHAVQMTRF